MATKSSGAVSPKRTEVEVMQAYAEMLKKVPTTDEDGMDRVYEAILDAETPESLNDAMAGGKSDDVLGKTITVHEIKQGESDYKDGLGFFLVVSYTLPGQGEIRTFSVGAPTVVLTLLKAHDKGWLPMDVEITRSERKTKAGFYPLNIKVLGISFDNNGESF